MQNLELGRDKKADCLSVYGLMELASCRELEQGTYGYRTDREGCVISKGLAMDLFGAVEVTGKRVVCRDRPYICLLYTSHPRKRRSLIKAQSMISFCPLPMTAAGGSLRSIPRGSTT